MNSHMLHLRSAGAQAFVVLALFAGSASAQVLNPQRIVERVDARTIASNGGGTAATLTLTPTASYVTLTCNDADGCAITMGESGIPDGLMLLIVNVSANTCTFSDTSGVSELTGTVALTQWQSLALQYVSDRWVQAAGGSAGTVTTTGSPASGNLAKFSGASSLTNADLTGDVTTSGTVATTIANDAVSNAKLRNSGALSVIGRSANSSGDPADISAVAASDCVYRESGSTVGCGTVATAGLANDAVTFAKIQNSSTTSVLVGRGGAAGTGDFQEIALGAGLSMAGTTISSTVVGTGGGDVVGPSSATDNAIARFDSTTGKLIQNSAVTLDDTGVFAFPDGVRQTFNPDGTNAGVNVGSQAGDPGSPSNGDLWYNSSSNALKARVNGSTVSLGAGSSPALLVESGSESKISALSADTSPTTDDLIATVNDPGGTPANKKVTIANLVKQIGLIGYTSYAPATNTTVSTTSTTLAAIDGTNLTLTFTAPQSGKVLGRLSAFADISTSAQHYQWAILDGSNALVSGASVGPITLANGAPISGEFIVTGLTPGNSYTWKWAHGVTGGATGRTIYGPGVTSTTVSTSNMVKPAVMEVWAVQ